jgi:hypothetical protein
MFPDLCDLAFRGSLRNPKESGLIIIQPGLARFLLHLRRDRVYFDCALGLGALDAEFADCGVDAALLTSPAFGNRRNLRRFMSAFLRRFCRKSYPKGPPGL